MRALIFAVAVAALRCSQLDVGGEQVDVAGRGINLNAFAIGRMTSSGNGIRRTYVQHDLLGRPVSTEHAIDGRVYREDRSYGYPQGGPAAHGPALQSVTTLAGRPQAETVSITYDAAGARQTVTAGAQVIVGSTRYNARAQPAELAWGNGTRTLYVYDDATLRLRQSQTMHTGRGEVQQQLQYTYDEASNVTRIDDALPPFLHQATYAYDSLDQLTSFAGAASRSYGYDSVGNLTTHGARAQTYGPSASDPDRGPHALATSGGLDYIYDRNGNLEQTRDASGAVTAITWNPQNMPVRVVHRGVEKYRKAFVGETLVRKHESGTGTTTYYLPGVHVERQGTIERYRRFYDELAERAPERSDTLVFYAGDHLGSPTLITDENGVVLRKAAYLPFGEKVQPAAASFDPKYEYTFAEEEVLDSDTSFVDFGARLLLPKTGRFASPDTITKDGLNRYTYVSNNPLKFIDPTGHRKKTKEQPIIVIFVGADGTRGETNLGVHSWAESQATRLRRDGYDVRVVSGEARRGVSTGDILKTLKGLRRDGEKATSIWMVGHAGWDGPIARDSQFGTGSRGFNKLARLLADTLVTGGRCFAFGCHTGGSNVHEDTDPRFERGAPMSWVRDLSAAVKERGQSIYVIGPRGSSGVPYYRQMFDSGMRKNPERQSYGQEMQINETRKQDDD